MRWREWDEEKGDGKRIKQKLIDKNHGMKLKYGININESVNGKRKVAKWIVSTKFKVMQFNFSFLIFDHQHYIHSFLNWFWYHLFVNVFQSKVIHFEGSKQPASAWYHVDVDADADSHHHSIANSNAYAQ